MPPQKKRVRKSRDELHQKEAADKHSTLVHMSTKSLRKEAKVVKTFQCQKTVRKIKELKETLSASDSASGTNEKSGDEKGQRKLHALDEKLKATKEFDIDCIVQVALRRLGLNNESDNETGNEDKQSVSDIFTKETIETMLKHKRLSTAMNSVSEKVSEYNAWLSRREDWLASKKGKINNLNEKEDSKKRGKKRGRHVDVAGHDGDTGMFIESLSGTAVPRQDEPGLSGYEGYGEYEEEYHEQMPKKKNRMGQRQRKAKAMAMESKKAGRLLDSDSSTNWREKKQKSMDEPMKEESASGLDKSKTFKAAEVASMGKTWKEEGKAHPSWAAREAQKAKSGIVAFAGKKITFD
jgi:hypothetical protein